jgi:hypothetical protein
MPGFIEQFGNSIEEFWEAGFFFTTPTYRHMMQAVGDHPIRRDQPTRGMTRCIDQVRIAVLALHHLAGAVHLRVQARERELETRARAVPGHQGIVATAR